MKKFLKIAIISIVLFALVGWLALFNIPTLKTFTDYFNGAAYNNYDFYEEDNDFLTSLEKSSDRLVTISTKEQSKSKGAWKNDSVKETMFAKKGISSNCLFYIRETVDDTRNIDMYVYHQSSSFNERIDGNVISISEDAFQTILIDSLYLYDAFDSSGNVIGSDFIFESENITSRNRKFFNFTTTAVSGNTKVEVTTSLNNLADIKITETFSPTTRRITTYHMDYSFKLDFSI